MTKTEAVRICYHLWVWMAENPKMNKYEWPLWKHFPECDDLDCPACAYNNRKVRVLGERDECQYCPLLDLWGGRTQFMACCNPKSPYIRWEEATEDDKVQIEAQKIADYCAQWLKKRKVRISLEASCTRTSEK